MSCKWTSAASTRYSTRPKTRGALARIDALACVFFALITVGIGTWSPAQEPWVRRDAAYVADLRYGNPAVPRSTWAIRQRGVLERLPPVTEELRARTYRLPPTGSDTGSEAPRNGKKAPSSHLTRDPALERLSPYFTSQVVVTGRAPPAAGNQEPAPSLPPSPTAPAPGQAPDQADDQAAESPSDANPPPASPDGNGTYGREPPQTRSEQTFLRTQSPLLEPGSWQIDVGAAYLMTEFDFPAYSGTEIVRGELRRRQMIAPLAFRYGLTERAQFFCNAPVGWRHNQIATNPMTDLDPFDLNDVHVGIGDMQVGASYLARKSDGKNQSPDIVLTFSATLPTGEGLIPVSILQGGLGSGIPSLGGQALFIHTYDPAVVFWGFGYRHSFERAFSGVDVQVGEEFSGQLGIGFAVNDRLTLSTSYLGGFVTETQVDGLGIPNSFQELHRARFAVTISQDRRILEPFVEIGLTQQTPTTHVGIVWTFGSRKKSDDKSSDESSEKSSNQSAGDDDRSQGR